MAIHNRANVRQMIARRLGRFEIITATGGTTLTAISTHHLFRPDDYWNGAILYVQSADSEAPEKEERIVTDYDQSTQTLTVGLAFTADIANGDILEIHAGHTSVIEIQNLISDAVKEASLYWYKEVWDTTTVDWAAGTFSYSLPAGVQRLRSVHTRPTSSQRWKPFPHWEVKGQMGAYYLIVSSNGGIGDIALHYEATLEWDPAVVTDASALNISAGTGANQYDRSAVNFIVELTVERLLLKLASEGDDAHRNFYWNMGRLAREERLRIAKEEAMPPLAGQVQHPGWQEHDYNMRGRAYSRLSGGGTKPGT